MVSWSFMPYLKLLQSSSSLLVHFKRCNRSYEKLYSTQKCFQDSFWHPCGKIVKSSSGKSSHSLIGVIVINTYQIYRGCRLPECLFAVVYGSSVYCTGNVGVWGRGLFAHNVNWSFCCPNKNWLMLIRFPSYTM